MSDTIDLALKSNDLKNKIEYKKCFIQYLNDTDNNLKAIDARTQGQWTEDDFFSYLIKRSTSEMLFKQCVSENVWG